MSSHKIVFADSRNMKEIKDGEVQLVITSPPYFNAPFDYKDFFKSYDEFLNLMKDVAKELWRVVEDGRIVCINCDDMLVDGEKFPIVADITKIFLNQGFRYRDKIIWKKPDGYVRISRRSGVLLQHPYPMYYYPDNLQETILIFQKGKFEFNNIEDKYEKSRIDIKEFQKNKWYHTVWEMTNVLPNAKLEKQVAAFPDELPYRLIKLFSFVGDTILDPFLGSATTTKVAINLNRNSIGYEINEKLEKIIKKKIGFDQKRLDNKKLNIRFIKRNQ